MSTRSRRRKVGARLYRVEEGPLTLEAAQKLDASRETIPFADMVALAELLLSQGHDFIERYVCQHCGMPQAIADIGEGRVYTEGRCEECHGVTNIQAVGGSIVGFHIDPADRERFLAEARKIHDLPDHYWAHQGRDA